MLLDGKKVSGAKKEEIALRVAELKKNTGKVPVLAAILVGEDPASKVYVKNKENACTKVGFNSIVKRLPEDTTAEELLKLVEEYNKRDDINGILVQLPLPKHINEDVVIEHIDPLKDVDCFHPYNVGRLSQGKAVFMPATPAGVLEILKYYNISTEGKNAVIIGRSNIVGKPMAAMLMQKGKFANATVTVVHSRTPDIKALTLQADIIVAAIGKPEFVTSDMVKEGVVAIDVGINRVEDASLPKGYKLVGDIQFKTVAEKAAAITPVPGGVGPMTIAMLLQNTLTAFEVQNGLK